MRSGCTPPEPTGGTGTRTTGCNQAAAAPGIQYEPHRSSGRTKPIGTYEGVRCHGDLRIDVAWLGEWFPEVSLRDVVDSSSTRESPLLSVQGLSEHARENSHLSLATGRILLIRRSPSRVHGRPRRSMEDGSQLGSQSLHETQGSNTLDWWSLGEDRRTLRHTSFCTNRSVPHTRNDWLWPELGAPGRLDIATKECHGASGVVCGGESVGYGSLAA